MYIYICTRVDVYRGVHVSLVRRSTSLGIVRDASRVSTHTAVARSRAGGGGDVRRELSAVIY